MKPARRDGFTGEAPPPLGDVLSLMRLVWSVDHELQRASKRMEAELGVTGPQRLVIRVVGQFPGISATRLASLLCVHPSTLTGVLRRLESGRLVLRRRDPRDARRWHIGLTAAGRRVDARIEGTVEAAVRDTLRDVGAADIAATHSVLERLVGRLNAPRA